jgi:hypothetical protein
MRPGHRSGDLSLILSVTSELLVCVTSCLLASKKLSMLRWMVS